MSKRPVFPSRDQQRRALPWWIFSASKGGRGYLARWLGCGHKERRAGGLFWVACCGKRNVDRRE